MSRTSPLQSLYCSLSSAQSLQAVAGRSVGAWGLVGGRTWGARCSVGAPPPPGSGRGTPRGRGRGGGAGGAPSRGRSAPPLGAQRARAAPGAPSPRTPPPCPPAASRSLALPPRRPRFHGRCPEVWNKAQDRCWHLVWRVELLCPGDVVIHPWARGVLPVVEHLPHVDALVAVLLEELRQGGEVAPKLPEPGVEVHDLHGGG